MQDKPARRNTTVFRAVSVPRTRTATAFGLAGLGALIALAFLAAVDLPRVDRLRVATPVPIPEEQPQAQPGQVAAVSHGCPLSLFRGVNVLNTAAESGQ